ncbi:MAG: class I SAM-dependent methyltransferase [Bacteroidales bacterium]|nr:class I SAM-dependent methyltransferase [Bacteroidales bacterium]
MKAIIKFFVRHIPRPYLIKFSKLFSLIVMPFYAGKKHQCTICEKSFRKFLPYGNKGAANRLCPNCLSLERHRLLWLFLKEKTRFFNEKYSVLHIAPEQPFLKRFKKLSNLEYITADLVSPIADVKIDIRSMPFENERFDVVICNHVLEHIDDDLKAMSEVYRVLKNNGFAILQVPIDYKRTETYEDASITDRKSREEIFGQYDHVRVYGLDYGKRLVKAGFVVDENRFVESFTKEQIEFYRLDANEILYIAYKK